MGLFCSRKFGFSEEGGRGGEKRERCLETPFQDFAGPDRKALASQPHVMHDFRSCIQQSNQDCAEILNRKPPMPSWEQVAGKGKEPACKCEVT